MSAIPAAEIDRRLRDALNEIVMRTTTVEAMRDRLLIPEEVDVLWDALSTETQLVAVIVAAEAHKYWSEAIDGVMGEDNAPSW